MKSRIIPSKDIIKYINHTLKKYNEPTIPVAHEFHEMYMYWKVNEYYMRELYIPNLYKQYISDNLKNNNVRFIVLPLIMYHPQSIMFPEYTMNYVQDNHGCSHASVVIYDKFFGYVERFDPGNNVYFYDGHILDTILVNTLSNSFSIKVQGINTPWMICKTDGIQTLQESEIYFSNQAPKIGYNIGFCTLFVVWYIEQRLKNKELSPHSIIENTLEMSRNTKHKYPLTRMFVKFSNKIRKHTDNADKLRSKPKGP